MGKNRERWRGREGIRNAGFFLVVLASSLYVTDRECLCNSSRHWNRSITPGAFIVIPTFAFGLQNGS